MRLDSVNDTLVHAKVLAHKTRHVPCKRGHPWQYGKAPGSRSRNYADEMLAELEDELIDRS